MTDAYYVTSGLPVERANSLQRVWVELQLRGVLLSAGLKNRRVQADVFRLPNLLSGKTVRKVSLHSDGMPAAGMSVDSWSIALSKAVGELCESVAWHAEVHDSGDTRSGWAGGPKRDAAIRSAYVELVERDSLIAHFLCRELKSEQLPWRKEFTMNAQLARLWSADGSIAVVLCGWRPGPGEAWFLGAGAAEDVERATLKAYLEMASIACGYRYADSADLQPQSRHVQAIAHIAESKNPPAIAALEHIFSGGGTVVPGFEATPAGMIVKSTRQFGRALHVAQVEHPALCPFSWGQTWERSRDRCQALLGARGLSPAWRKHPFA